MKKLLPLLLIVLAACNSKSNQPDKKNVDIDYLISLDGIGPVKNGMSQDELEKLLNKKIPLTNPRDTISGSWMDSAFIKYKEADLRLTFVRSYEDDHRFHMRMTDIQTSSPLCKSKEGIGIGSGKDQVIDAFQDHILFIAPDFEDTSYTTRSKTHSSIIAREDREGREIIFYLKDNKVYAIKVGSFYDDSE
jgi:hypothetical protein